MAYWLKTDGTRLEVHPKKGKEFTLEELQEFVGGYIEHVSLANNYDMWLNEEGKLQGLPFNLQAQQEWSAVYGQTDIIVGNVLITEEGETS